MRLGTFSIEGENCFTLASKELEDAFKVRYTRPSANSVTYLFEDNNLITSSGILIVVMLVQLNNFICVIEVVSGGGSDNILSMAVGKESRLIERIYDTLEYLCSGLDYKISTLRTR